MYLLYHYYLGEIQPGAQNRFNEIRNKVTAIKFTIYVQPCKDQLQYLDTGSVVILIAQASASSGRFYIIKLCNA